MGHHTNTVFKNSCLKVPLDPVNRLPVASYERISPGAEIPKPPDNDLTLKEFYKSIPDYHDLNHLSNKEFYMKLDSLREKKQRILLKSQCDIVDWDVNYSELKPKTKREKKLRKSESYNETIRKYLDTKIASESLVSDFDSVLSSDKKIHSPNYERTRKIIINGGTDSNLSNARKSYSVPTSPVRKSTSPFPNSPHTKLYDKYAEDKLLTRLNDYAKELQKIYQGNKRATQFKANPVPIESRIPLYEKILEDQELRRAISKLQSKAELEAQMKPFSFTEREEKWGLKDKLGCSRIYRSNPQLSVLTPTSESDSLKCRPFKAKPIPKNLFSNYVYERMREDEFYRAMNRRIRAEEMLKASTLPPSMAKREKSERRLSPCSRYHDQNDTNCDSIETNHRRRSRSRRRVGKQIMDELKQQEMENSSNEVNGVDSNDKNKQYNFEEELKRIYSNDTPTTSSGYGTRPRSAVDMSAVNKSNLAAILRIQTSKKKLEADLLKQLEEDRFQSEIKWRDSVLRKKPAWKSLHYNHADDLAMRLQMRKDEERLKREQFLHEMELMYGRVNEQPMMFERTYSPRRGVKTKEPSTKRRSSLNKHFLSADMISPNRSRKVSINDTPETIDDDYTAYKNSDDNSTTKSDDDIIECIPDRFDK